MQSLNIPLHTEKVFVDNWANYLIKPNYNHYKHIPKLNLNKLKHDGVSLFYRNPHRATFTSITTALPPVTDARPT